MQEEKADIPSLLILPTHIAPPIPTVVLLTQEAIQKYLEHECTTLPLQTLIPRCQMLVDTYLALFISSLEGQIVSSPSWTNSAMNPS